MGELYNSLLYGALHSQGKEIKKEFKKTLPQLGLGCAVPIVILIFTVNTKGLKEDKNFHTRVTALI